MQFDLQDVGVEEGSLGADYFQSYLILVLAKVRT
jgi:hypothetical protein